MAEKKDAVPKIQIYAGTSHLTYRRVRALDEAPTATGIFQE